MLLRRLFPCFMVLEIACIFVQATVTTPKAVTQSTKKAPTKPKDAAEKVAQRKATQTINPTKELIKSVIDRDLENVTKWISKGADVNATNNGSPLLIYAVTNGMVEIVEALLDAPTIKMSSSARIEARTQWYNAKRQHNDQHLKAYSSIIDLLANKQNKLDQSLLKAVEIGNIGDVKKALNQGAFIDVVGKYSWTPLITAIYKGKTEIAIFLINNGTSFNIGDSNGMTPFAYAITIDTKASLEIARHLIDKGYDVNSIINSDKDTALIYAARNNYENIVKTLVTAPFLKLDAKDIRGKTALMWATERGHKNIVTLLNDKQKQLETSLAEAVWANKKEYVESLLAVDVNVNAKVNLEKGNDSFKETTALMFAAIKGNLNLLEYLLKNGADPSIKDSNGRNVVMLAVLYGQLDIVKYFSTFPHNQRTGHVSLGLRYTKYGQHANRDFTYGDLWVETKTVKVTENSPGRKKYYYYIDYPYLPRDSQGATVLDYAKNNTTMNNHLRNNLHLGVFVDIPELASEAAYIEACAKNKVRIGDARNKIQLVLDSSSIYPK